VSVRVAALDCGTNALRLLVADVDVRAGTMTAVHRCTEIVRLGQGVDATGEISPAAMRRALDVIAGYARLCTAAGAGPVRCVATSASRDARNAAVFATAVRDLLGVEPEVVSGAEEARLSFLGAARALAGRPSPALVVDLGGGSTEVVLGDAADGRIEAAVSVDVGSVRVTERHLRSDPPTATELAAARADVAAALVAVGAAVDVGRARTVIGLAGTVMTVAAHALRLDRLDPRDPGRAIAAAVEGRALPLDGVRAACAELIALPRQARAALPYLHPGRVDVIAGGALIWDLLLTRVAERAPIREVVASEHDILDGVAWALGGA
jgi:exopolyphosphatase / guanosine-5'-triphosphate,3'-diphosphate pyrophosphatase